MSTARKAVGKDSDPLKEEAYALALAWTHSYVHLMADEKDRWEALLLMLTGFERTRIRSELIALRAASPAGPPHLYDVDIFRICPDAPTLPVRQSFVLPERDRICREIQEAVRFAPLSMDLVKQVLFGGSPASYYHGGSDGSAT